MPQLETSVERSVESECSKASASTNTVSNESESTAEQCPQIIVDIKLEEKTASSASSASPKSTDSESKRKRRDVDFGGNGIIMLLLSLVIVNFYFFLTYSSKCKCVKDYYSIDPDFFCLVSGMLTFPSFIVSVMMKKNGTNPEDTISKPKCLFCMHCWSLLWAVLGVCLYVLQFNEQCRTEPIAIVILVWSRYVVPCGCTYVNVKFLRTIC